MVLEAIPCYLLQIGGAIKAEMLILMKHTKLAQYRGLNKCVSLMKLVDICTYQNNILRVFAMSSAKQTYKENPSASCVFLICLYCGMYGATPPIIIAPAAPHPTRWPTVSPNSSEIIQSIVSWILWTVEYQTITVIFSNIYCKCTTWITNFIFIITLHYFRRI